MVKYVSYADLEQERLRIGEHSTEAIDLLYDFGILLINEVGGRANQIDVKLGIYLATSVGMIAILVSVADKVLSRGAATVCLIAAFLAMLISAMSLLSGLWPFPSELAWFNSKEIADSDRLKRTYVLALLESHHYQQKRVVLKSKFLFAIESLLIVSALAIIIALPPFGRIGVILP